MNEPIRVLVADDHPLFRAGLAGLLTAAPDTELAGTATTGTEAVEIARQIQPDVVLMDLHMPDLNGIEATRRIVAGNLHIAVVVLTMFGDDDSIFEAVRAGAHGYLLKGAGREQIRRAVHAAADGETIFGAGLATRVLVHLASAPPGPEMLSAREPAAGGAAARPQAMPALPGLTPAEQAVARLVAAGHTNKQAAAELYVSVKTVEFHLGHIFDKLGIRSRRDLTACIGAIPPFAERNPGA